MVQIKPKTVVKMQMSATGETHARSRIRVRDVQALVDEPLARDGTNTGPSPTETLMSSLMGCTNVITKRIAQAKGIATGEMHIALTANLDRRGAMLLEEIEQPFSDIVMDITLETDATPAQMDQIVSDLAKFCPIAKVLRNSGVSITENWTTKPL